MKFSQFRETSGTTRLSCAVANLLLVCVATVTCPWVGCGKPGSAPESLSSDLSEETHVTADREGVCWAAWPVLGASRGGARLHPFPRHLPVGAGLGL